MSDALVAAAVDDLRNRGFAVLLSHLPDTLVDECRQGLRPPNTTRTPRFLVSTRYVRGRYSDDRRDVRCIPKSL
jgi:hypothetical protein